MEEIQLMDVPRSKIQARRSYDRMSRFYDLMAGSSEWKLTRVGLQMLNAGLSDRILEIGAGTGKALANLSHQLGDRGVLIGLDLSGGMLQKASARLKQGPISANVLLIQADGAFPPFPTETFDAIFLSFTLELFDTPELPEVLSRCRQLLHPGGRIGVVALARPDPPGPAVHLYEFFHRLLPSYVDCRPIPTGALLRQAGFSISQEKRMSMWGLPVDVILATRPPI